MLKLNVAFTQHMYREQKALNETLLRDNDDDEQLKTRLNDVLDRLELSESTITTPSIRCIG